MHKNNKSKGLWGYWCGEGPECETIEAVEAKQAAEVAAVVEATKEAEAGEQE